MELHAKLNVGAIFKCTVRKANTHEIAQESGEFANLVLDTGLARMSVGAWIDRCVVGSGNSNPTTTQVQLDSFVGSTTTVATGVADAGGFSITEPPYWYGRRTWRFAVGTATGNLSEIGLGWGNSSLWNRALIKDNNGNPTTLTVLADEYLDVFCEVRVYPSVGSGTFNVVDKLGNTVSTHSYIYRPVLATGGGPGGAIWNASKISFGTGNSFSGGFNIDSSGIVDNYTTPITKTFSKLTSTYVPTYPTATSAKMDCQTTSTEANMTHKSFLVPIGGFMCSINNSNTLNFLCAYKWEITPAIAKTSSMILTYSATLSWGRYTP